MKGGFFTLLLLGLLQCDNNDNASDCTGKCEVEATVVDMTGLDGCSIMFELADGTRIEPERRTYVTAPSIAEDPLYHFDLKVGQKVRISYEESLALSICMAGPIVFVTCISECEKPAN
ncbi:MAG: hypothetical protein RIB47_12700 [Cyclobacteriaceae bacterium]